MSAQTATLAASPRALGGKGTVRAARRAGKVPAVIYGGKGLTRAARFEAEAAISLAPSSAQAEIRRFLDSQEE